MGREGKTMGKRQIADQEGRITCYIIEIVRNNNMYNQQMGWNLYTEMLKRVPFPYISPG